MNKNMVVFRRSGCYTEWERAPKIYKCTPQMY